MNTTTLYRRIRGLLAGVALLVSCSLFSGCLFFHLVYGPLLAEDLFGEHQDQFPTVVLSVEKPGPVEFAFTVKDTATTPATTVGGAKVTKFLPSRDFWRMNVYSFSDGESMSNNKFKPITEVTETFPNLPLDKILRVDLDIADNLEGTKNRKSYSAQVLFHYEK